MRIISIYLPKVNLIHFYNPFTGSILEMVRKTHSSYVENPRKIFIIYFNNDHFDKILVPRLVN